MKRLPALLIGPWRMSDGIPASERQQNVPQPSNGPVSTNERYVRSPGGTVKRYKIWPCPRWRACNLPLIPLPTHSHPLSFIEGLTVALRDLRDQNKIFRPVELRVYFLTPRPSRRRVNLLPPAPWVTNEDHRASDERTLHARPSDQA